MAVGHAPAKDLPEVSRREFLRFGGVGMLGLSLAEQQARAAAKARRSRSCIFLLLTGGPSQFETFDPKPHAPVGFRGPYRPISTAVAGVQFSETLPHLAQRADRFAVIRSMWHNAAPLHETGQQLIQTGRLARLGRQYPSLGASAAYLLGDTPRSPAHVVLPRLLSKAGVMASDGQGGGFLGPQFDPHEFCQPLAANGPAASAMAIPRLPPESDLQFERYGGTPFGEACWNARRLVEQGTRFVTVNMYDSLAGTLSWDCHATADSAPTTLADYRDTVCPTFDRACAALLDDLQERGLLETTLVVAVGEFGRTPRMNVNGGRDHWPGVWSALIAGGGVQGGQVIGESDTKGAAPAHRPVHPSELAATILTTLGIPLQTTLSTPNGEKVPLIDAAPIAELFA